MDIEWIDRGDGVKLACRHVEGIGPTVVFLPGYMSDMDGTKAQTLAEHAHATGHACLLLDYSGCGASEGDFHAGSVRRWSADAAAVIAARAPDGPLLLVGSSMGGWIMLHLAMRLGAQVRGLIGIAAAPDFSAWGLELSEADHTDLRGRGWIERPSAYGDRPYTYSRAFLDDAAAACVLGAEIAIDCPVRLLQGQCDPDVPWETALRLATAMRSDDVRTVLIKDGDHRLSRPEDLALLLDVVEELA